MDFNLIVEILNDLSSDKKKNQILRKLLRTISDNITIKNLINLFDIYFSFDGQHEGLSIILENHSNNINTLDILTVDDICKLFDIVTFTDYKVEIFKILYNNNIIKYIDDIKTVKIILDNIILDKYKQQILNIINTDFALNDIYNSINKNNIKIEYC